MTKPNKDERVLQKGYIGEILSKKSKAQNRIMVGIPMTGLVRSEWVIARYGQVIPCNWSEINCLQWIDQFSPLNFLVADARNLIANSFIEKEFEWLFFIDHDVILPPTTLLRMNEYMRKGDIPMFSGLYFSKSVPSEPLIYRGRGNSYYTNWKLGDLVWADGIAMGLTMIHNSILKALYDESEEYEIGGRIIRKIFETPAKTFYDPEKHSWYNQSGTEDLTLCTRIMENDIFKKAGWPKFQRKKNPFAVDTSLFARHIDWDGIQYPSKGEELEFVKEDKN